MKAILLLGATGTVGCYTALHLKGIGYDIIAVGRRPSDGGFFADHEIPYVSVDIRDPDSFANIPAQDQPILLHFAGLLPSKMKGYYPNDYVQSIVQGTLNVLEYGRRVKADRIVFTQTRADTAYLAESGVMVSSDARRSFPPVGDHSVYAICKNAAVDLIEHYYQMYGLRRFILRLPTIYAYTPDPYFFVNGRRRLKAYRYMMERARCGLPLEVWGDPTREKEIVYIKDFCQIAEKAATATHDGGIYNVGRGQGVTIEEQVLGIAEVFSPQKRKSQIVYCPEKPDGRCFVHDISKTRTELGYKPAFDYLSGLRDFKRYMEDNPFKRLWGRAVQIPQSEIA